jgi:hypothetical protein
MRRVEAIFLDVDGVLYDNGRPLEPEVLDKYSSEHPLLSESQVHDYARVELFGKDAVANLERLVFAKDNRVVVLCSAWRIRKTPAQLKKLFSRYRFSERVVGRTPSLRDDTAAAYGRYLRTTNFKTSKRAYEVKCWLARSEYFVESFVVLDDSDDGHSETYPSNYVRVNPDELLSEEDALAAEEILTRSGNGTSIGPKQKRKATSALKTRERRLSRDSATRDRRKKIVVAAAMAALKPKYEVELRRARDAGNYQDMVERQLRYKLAEREEELKELEERAAEEGVHPNRYDPMGGFGLETYYEVLSGKVARLKGEWERAKAEMKAADDEADRIEGLWKKEALESVRDELALIGGRRREGGTWGAGF